MPQTRIGISGWRYEPWRGRFYAPDLTQKKELWFASRALSSIEINGTFYSLQRPNSFKQWHDETPDDFRFSVKGGRYITHIRRLNDVEEPLANFFASGILRLAEKLGPILWQFPPNFIFDAEKIERFFDLLPRDTSAAAKLGKEHTAILKNRSWTKIDENRPLRHAIEVRHHSFEDEKFLKLLRAHNVALVIADTAGKWPYMEDITADFVYARLHGEEELYVSGYGDAALDRWAARFEIWRGGGEPADAKRFGKAALSRKRGRDIYCYFDNDVKVYAPFDAMGLMKRLGVESELRDEVVMRQRDPNYKSPKTRARAKWPNVKKDSA